MFHRKFTFSIEETFKPFHRKLKLSIEKLAGLKLKLIFKLRKARLFAYMFASSEEEYANEVKRHGFFCYHRFVEKY